MVSLLVHAVAVGGLIKHAAEGRAPRALRSVSVALAEPARASPRTADTLDPADVAERAEAARPPLRVPTTPAVPPRTLDPDDVPVLLPRPVAPLFAPDLLPPAASVLVSIRAVRPEPPPPVPLPEVVLPPDVLAARAPAPDAPRPDDASPPPTDASAPGADSAAVIAPEPSATNRPPRYPTLSRRLGEQGEVVIRALVGEDGRVLEAEVAQSSGHTRLDEAALAAVRAWLFSPATRAGRPVVHPLEIPVLFELQE